MNPNYSSYDLKPSVWLKGYRKAVLFRSGGIRISAERDYRSTKEEFERDWAGHTLLGEWQEVEYEIDE